MQSPTRDPSAARRRLQSHDDEDTNCHKHNECRGYRKPLTHRAFPDPITLRLTPPRRGYQGSDSLRSGPSRRRRAASAEVRTGYFAIRPLLAFCVETSDRPLIKRVHQTDKPTASGQVLGLRKSSKLLRWIATGRTVDEGHGHLVRHLSNVDDAPWVAPVHLSIVVAYELDGVPNVHVASLPLLHQPDPASNAASSPGG